jgi:hypothetical protein
LVFLDVNRANSREKLREVYIHEAAHLLCEDQDHGISFAVVNNTLRIKSGFAPSKVDYDYRSADWDGLSVSDAKSLSVQIANYAMERGVSATVIAEAMRYVLAVRIPSGIDTTTRSRKILDTFSVYIGGE